MSSKSILVALAGLTLVGAALAAPVETSLRPKARPGMAAPPVTTGIATRNIVFRSLRPLARPAGLATMPVARAAVLDPGLASWIRRFRGRALAQGIRPGVFEAAFRNARYDTEAIDRDRNQAEFKSAIWDYLDNAASPPRVEDGQRMLRRYRRALDRIERSYGVDREVVIAIWGLESRYGTRMGDHSMIDALATLAHDGRRGRFFENQLVAALKILQSGDVSVSDFKGSWAGAMGHTQFIPTSYLAYAVDFTGDGKRDIWSDDPTDALASTARYLSRFGWNKDQPWGVEVRLPRGFDASQASRSIRRMPSRWARAGVTDMNGQPVPDHGRASILLPAGRDGAAFMIFDNFAVLERYNNADAYVIGVGYLADRIKGGPPIQASWPRGYQPLSFAEKKELQRRLRDTGHGVEKIDGLIGPNTTTAIRGFQQSVGMQADGFPSKAVLARLRGG